jgi:hypothetical protein
VPPGHATGGAGRQDDAPAGGQQVLGDLAAGLGLPTTSTPERTGWSAVSRSNRWTTSAPVRKASRSCSPSSRFIHPGVFSRNESQRWVRQLSPARSRYRTTCSTPRSASAALAASPAGPAPTTTQSTLVRPCPFIALLMA